MEVIFNTYFANGVSWDKLMGEMPTNDKGQKYRIRIKNNLLQVARYLFEEEHKEGCCHNLPGGSEYFDEVLQNEIKNIFINHVPNTIPFYLQITIPPNATLGGIISALLAQYEIISAEEFTDAFAYIHFGVLPDLQTVQNIISNYEEPEKADSVYFSKKASQNIIASNTGEFLTSIQPNEIIVSKNSGQFTTIAAALEFLKTLQDKSVIIKIYPGIYFENATLDLPNYVCLIGEGSAGNTTIIGTHTGPVINTHAFNFVKNLNIIGGSVGINHDGSDPASFSLIKDCMIKIAGTTGIVVSGGVGSLSVSHISIYADLSPTLFPFSTVKGTGKGVIINGGSFIASELIIQAQVEEGLDFKDGLGTLDLVSVYYAQKGLCCSGKTKIKGTLVNLVDCHTGLNICSPSPPQSGGENPQICLNYLHIDRATIDIQTDAAADLEIYSGHIDPDKVIKNVPVNLTGNFYTNDEGVQQNIIGNNHVHGSINFLPNEKFATKHLTLFENYFILPQGGASFSLPSFSSPLGGEEENEKITQLFYWSGTVWTSLKFVNHDIFYWLPLEIPQQKTIINGIEDYWIKTDILLKEIEFSIDSMMIKGAETFYLNRSRKKKIIYPTGSIFITPVGADTTAPYKIIIKANLGITVNGTFFAQNYVETTADWTATDLQSFTMTASGLTLLAIAYYELYN